MDWKHYVILCDKNSSPATMFCMILVLLKMQVIMKQYIWINMT